MINSEHLEPAGSPFEAQGMEAWSAGVESTLRKCLGKRALCKGTSYARIWKVRVIGLSTSKLSLLTFCALFRWSVRKAAQKMELQIKAKTLQIKAVAWLQVFQAHLQHSALTRPLPFLSCHVATPPWCSHVCPKKHSRQYVFGVQKRVQFWSQNQDRALCGRHGKLRIWGPNPGAKKTTVAWWMARTSTALSSLWHNAVTLIFSGPTCPLVLSKVLAHTPPHTVRVHIK